MGEKEIPKNMFAAFVVVIVLVVAVIGYSMTRPKSGTGTLDANEQKKSEDMVRQGYGQPRPQNSGAPSGAMGYPSGGAGPRR